MSSFDVVGIGLNATDTVILVPHFPPYAGKVAFDHEMMSPGGQVASAMVTCARLGLRTRYIGTIGDDERGRIQWDSLANTGIDLEHVQVRKGVSNQTAYIIIDRTTGERTVFWSRPEQLRLQAGEIREEMIVSARLLHIDGHDTEAVEKAAQIARAHGMPVTVDVDTIYPGFERVLPHVTHLIASQEWPVAWTKEKDALHALERIQKEYRIPLAAMTLGSYGALALENGTVHYAPAFVVNCTDTTGAGDVFHGAFCYAVLEGMTMPKALEFSNAMAAINCRALGARGGIGTLADARLLIERGERRYHPEYAERFGQTAAR